MTQFSSRKKIFFPMLVGMSIAQRAQGVLIRRFAVMMAALLIGPTAVVAAVAEAPPASAVSYGDLRP
jgi:hypothetical protein